MIGKFKGATEPLPAANALNEVASNAMPAKPMMSRRLANTLATANK
jgi:hypothetical protein